MESENVWKKVITELKDVEILREKLPSEVIKEYCDKLEDVTDGNVLAKIGQYSHTIKQMTADNRPFQKFINEKITVKKNVTPQDYLGVIDDENRFTYEVYITGSKTKNYKYRFCFIEFGVPAYPVEIIIDDDIVDELGLQTTKLSINSVEELKTLFIKILNSNKITEVIKSLMAVNAQIE